MNCEHVEKLLTSYLLDDLPDDVSEEIRDHLEICDGCRAELREIEPTLGLLRDALAAKAEVPEALSEDRLKVIMEALPSPEDLKEPEEDNSVITWLFEGHPTFAKAAALFIVCLTIGIFTLPTLTMQARKSPIHDEDSGMQKESDSAVMGHATKTWNFQGGADDGSFGDKKANDETYKRSLPEPPKRSISSAETERKKNQIESLEDQVDQQDAEIAMLEESLDETRWSFARLKKEVPKSSAAMVAPSEMALDIDDDDDDLGLDGSDPFGPTDDSEDRSKSDITWHNGAEDSSVKLFYSTDGWEASADPFATSELPEESLKGRKSGEKSDGKSKEEMVLKSYTIRAEFGDIVADDGDDDAGGGFGGSLDGGVLASRRSPVKSSSERIPVQSTPDMLAGSEDEKIPMLGDIPIIGKLSFGSETTPTQPSAPAITPTPILRADNESWNATPADLNGMLSEMKGKDDANYTMEAKTIDEDSDYDGFVSWNEFGPDEVDTEISSRERKDVTATKTSGNRRAELKTGVVSQKVVGFSKLEIPNASTPAVPPAGDAPVSYAAKGKSGHKTQYGRSNVGRQGMAQAEVATTLKETVGNDKAQPKPRKIYRGKGIPASPVVKEREKKQSEKHLEAYGLKVTQEAMDKEEIPEEAYHKDEDYPVPADELVPLELELPKPMFLGTPKNIESPNLEKSKKDGDSDKRSNVGRQGMANARVTVVSGTINEMDVDREERRTQDPTQSGQGDASDELGYYQYNVRSAGGGKQGPVRADEVGDGMGGNQRMDSSMADGEDGMKAMMSKLDRMYDQASLQNVRSDALVQAHHHMGQMKDAIAKGQIEKVDEYKRKAVAALKKAQTELGPNSVAIVDDIRDGESDKAPQTSIIGGIVLAKSPESKRKRVVVAKAKQEKDEELTGPRFKAFGTNPFYYAKAKPFSTFAIDVDTASYTLARSYMLKGHLPVAESVRTEEFVNFFNYAYKAPEHKTFGVYTECAPSEFGQGLHLLKVGVKGKRLGREEKRKAILTFAIDTSGSMNATDRINLVKKSLHMLIDKMDPEDQIAIIQFGNESTLRLEHTPVSQKEKIFAVIDNMLCTGSTNLEEAMKLAYKIAAKGFNSKASNRVFIMSDGAANLGTGAAEDILSDVARYRKQGIYCSVFGFGIGTYNDEMLETLANKGDGTYAFVDTEAEAKRLFVDDLSATLNTIASDVKIQLEFAPKFVARYRQLGYENRQLKKRQFRDNTVDAGEVGSGQSVTALYEIELPRLPSLREQRNSKERIATVRVRYRRADNGKVEEVEYPVKLADVKRQYADSSARFKLAACVAEFAEILRSSPFAEAGSYGDVAKALAPVRLELDMDKHVQELLRMVQGAGSMSRAQ